VFAIVLVVLSAVFFRATFSTVFVVVTVCAVAFLRSRSRQSSSSLVPSPVLDVEIFLFEDEDSFIRERRVRGV